MNTVLRYFAGAPSENITLDAILMQYWKKRKTTFEENFRAKSQQVKLTKCRQVREKRACIKRILRLVN